MDNKLLEIKYLKKQLENYKQLQRAYVALVEDRSFRCPRCFEKLIWDNDFDMKDIYDEDGLVSYYHCTDCKIDVEITERYDV